MLNILIVVVLLFHVTTNQLSLCHPNALTDKQKTNVQGKVQSFDEYPIAPPSLTNDQIEEFEEDQKEGSNEHNGLTPIKESQNSKSTKPTKKNVQRLKRHGNGRQEFGQQHQNLQSNAARQQSNQTPCYNGQPITLLQPYPLPPCAPQERQAGAQQSGGTYVQPNQYYGQQQRQFNPNVGAYNTGFGHQNGRGWHH